MKCVFCGKEFLQGQFYNDIFKHMIDCFQKAVHSTMEQSHTISNGQISIDFYTRSSPDEKYNIFGARDWWAVPRVGEYVHFVDDDETIAVVDHVHWHTDRSKPPYDSGSPSRVRVYCSVEWRVKIQRVKLHTLTQI